MARLKGTLNFTGSIGNLSAYSNRTTDATLIRLKGGASKKRIQKAPEFTNTRRNNTEFGGASSTGKKIKDAMPSLDHLDHSLYQSRLNSICRFIMNLDTEHEWGQRAVYISRYRHFFEGFNLEMGVLFDSIIKHPIQCSINRTDQSATIIVPELYPAISLYVPGKFSFFRFCVVLGIVPDMQYKMNAPKYVPVNAGIQLKRAELTTEWFSTNENIEEQNISLQIQGDTGLSDHDSLLLAIGVEFGNALSANLIKQANNAGAAKIMAVA